APAIGARKKMPITNRAGESSHTAAQAGLVLTRVEPATVIVPLPSRAARKVSLHFLLGGGWLAGNEPAPLLQHCVHPAVEHSQSSFDGEAAMDGLLGHLGEFDGNPLPFRHGGQRL